MAQFGLPEQTMTSTDPRPFVTINIHGVGYPALVDTGAVVSLINDTMVACLGREGVRPQKGRCKIALADNSQINLTDIYTFKGQIEGLEYQMSMVHLPSLTSPIILGMDLIGPLGLIEFKRKLLQKQTHNYADKSTKQLSSLKTLSLENSHELERFLDQELQKFDNCSGLTHLVEHKIKLKSEEPIKQRYYPRNPAMQQIIYDEVDRMLTEGVIEPSSSPWSSPVVLVKKSTGAYRFCLDFRRLNQASEKDAYPLPHINSILEKLREANFISTIDLKQGYWQVPLAPDSRPLTAFTVPGKGLYQFVVMPFGLHSAGATFQRLLDKIIGPELEPRAFAYLDDLIIVSATFEEHIEILKQVFERLRVAGLKVNPEKCKFCKLELKYLGHVVNEQGIQTDPEKVRAIAEFPKPTTVRALRAFLGLASWYRRFVENFAKITPPLTKLLRKGIKWEWKDSQDRAFQRLKDKLCHTPVLACPNFEYPFVLQVDASDEGLGAALTQQLKQGEVVIAYGSRLLTEGERKFTVTEKECLALVWAVKKFRPYLEGYHFIALSDHQALKWLMKLQQPSGRLARWVLELQQHDFEIQYRKGSLNKVADALSRNPTPAESPNYLCMNNEVSKDVSYQDWYLRTKNDVTMNPNKYHTLAIDGGRLLKRIFKKSEPKSDSTLEWKLCVPPENRDEVFRENHDLPTAGHLGMRKTVRRIQQRYYWPGMVNDIRAYVRRCLNCQAHKIEQAQPAGHMGWRKPVGPWYTVTADLMGPLPRSTKGSKYLLVVQDVYTKWVEFSPLRTATALSVSEAFRELVLLRFGSPEMVITDNGSQFTAKLWKDLITGWNIEHQLTAPYTPQENPVERSNRTLKTMISQYVKNDHKSWDRYLSEFRYAINTAVHDSTGFSPALLNLGRELRLPNAIHGPLRESCPLSKDTWGASITKRLGKLAEIYGKCQRNLTRAFASQAKYYNLRRREVKLKPGEKVWLRQHKLSSAAESFAAKLAAKYDGPFEVVRQVGANLYDLKDKRGRGIGKAHVKDLKRYVT